MVTTPARVGWLTWPVLRWGFVAAGVVVIAALGIRQYQLRSVTSTMAYKSPALALPESRSQAAAPATAAKQAENQDEAPASPPSASAYSVSNTDAAVDEPKRLAPAAPPPAATRGTAVHGAVSGTFGGPLVTSRKMPTQWQNNNAQQQVSNNAFQAQVTNQTGAASPAPPVPQANETVEAGGAAPRLDAATANQESRSRDQSANLREEYTDKISVSKSKQPGPLAAPGQIGGYVVDPTGAVVPNARITIAPTTAGGTATAVTNSQGAWLFAGLPTGNYKAQAEAPGFKTSVLDFRYDASQPSTYSFTLSPGNVSEVVEVSSAQNGLVQTEGSTIAGPIAKSEVSQIPVNGRNLDQLASPSAGPLPRWTISSTGSLQRSFDQGNTWQGVDVNAGVASVASFEIVAKASRTKEADKDADKKALKRDAATTNFPGRRRSGFRSVGRRLRRRTLSFARCWHPLDPRRPHRGRLQPHRRRCEPGIPPIRSTGELRPRPRKSGPPATPAKPGRNNNRAPFPRGLDAKPSQLLPPVPA